MRTARCTSCRPSAEVSARSTSAQPQPTAKLPEPERICSGSGNLCDWTMATSVGKQSQCNRSRAHSGLSPTSSKSKPRTLAISLLPRWSRKSPSISMPAKACTVTRTAGTGVYLPLVRFGHPPRPLFGKLQRHPRVSILTCHCEDRSDVGISMGLDTRRRTAVATATGSPRYARNDKATTREATPRLTRFGSRVTLSGRFRPQLLNNLFPGIGRQQTNSGLMGKAVKVRRGCATVSGKPEGYRRRHHNQAVANPESPGREPGILPDVLLELYSAPNRVVPLRHPLTGQNGFDAHAANQVASRPWRTCCARVFALHHPFKIT